MFSSTTGTPRRRPARKAGATGSPSPAPPSFNGALSPSSSSPSSPLSFNQSLQPPSTQQRASSSLRVVQYAGSVDEGDYQMDGGASDFGGATTQTRGDGRDSKVWVKDNRHEVFEQGGLPAEVEEVLKSAGELKSSLSSSSSRREELSTDLTSFLPFSFTSLPQISTRPLSPVLWTLPLASQPSSPTRTSSSGTTSRCAFSLSNPSSQLENATESSSPPFLLPSLSSSFRPSSEVLLLFAYPLRLPRPLHFHSLPLSTRPSPGRSRTRRPRRLTSRRGSLLGGSLSSSRWRRREIRFWRGHWIGR